MSDDVENVRFKFLEHINFDTDDTIGVVCNFDYRGRAGVYKTIITRALYEDKEFAEVIIRVAALQWARNNFGGVESIFGLPVIYV